MWMQIEMLNGPGWLVTKLELDRSNLKWAWTTPNSACNHSYWVGTVKGRFTNMDMLKRNRLGPLLCQTETI